LPDQRRLQNPELALGSLQGLVILDEIQELNGFDLSETGSANWVKLWLRGDYFDKRRPEATPKRLVKRLEQLGYSVSLPPTRRRHLPHQTR
jgi:hypothetical protein